MSFVIASFFYEISCIFLKIKDKSEKATLKRKFFDWFLEIKYTLVPNGWLFSWIFEGT